MKRSLLYISGGAALTLLVAGYLGYASLAPARHFRSDNLPVLASPAPLETTADSAAAGSKGPVSIMGAKSSSESDSAASGTTDGEAEARQGGSAESAPQQSSGFNVLILGVDSRVGEAGRSDVIMVAHVDPDKKKVNLVSVPRDTRVALPGVGQTKINHAYFLGQIGGGKQGVKSASEAVSRLFRIPIHYYVKTDFKGFEEVIDTIQGVDVNLPQDMRISSTGKVLPKGMLHMDGALALQFVRERYSLPGGDFDRQADQAALLRAVVQKMLSGDQVPQLPGIIKKVKSDIVETNLSVSDIASLALLFKDTNSQSIQHVMLPGKSVTEEDPLIGSKLWYWSADAKEVEAISRDYLR